MTLEKRFEGKGAVVTGAGRGIGRATAEEFAKEGAGVVLFGWHEDVLDEVADRDPRGRAARPSCTWATCRSGPPTRAP